MLKKLLALLSCLTILFLCFSSFAQQRAAPKTAPQQPTAQPQPVPKAPTIDPAMLRRLQAPIPRATMINSLLANQATRGMIENLAKTAKIQPSELSIKTLDGNPVSPTPQGQLIDQLNWSAGIRISMIKNRPTFSYPPRNSTLPLGWICLNRVNLSSESLSNYVNDDVFDVSFCSDITLNVHLPLTSATYMIIVQTSDLMGAEMTLSDRIGVRKIPNVIPLTSRDGYVAITQISPRMYGEGLGFGQFIVKFSFPVPPIFFSGFTITRL